MAEQQKTASNTPRGGSRPGGAGARRPGGFNRGGGGRGPGGGGNRPGGPRKGGNRPGGRRDGRGRTERPPQEFEQKILSIRRVTRVVAGGRRFSFSVTIAIGDRKGRVGVGLGKAGDTALAIEKAIRDAKNNMLRVSTTKTMSIPHKVASKYCAARVTIQPAPGKGLVAGSAVRNVLQLAGLTNINAKILSKSKNRLNNAKATLDALSQLQQQPQKKKPATAPAAQ